MKTVKLLSADLDEVLHFYVLKTSTRRCPGHGTTRNLPAWEFKSSNEQMALYC